MSRNPFLATFLAVSRPHRDGTFPLANVLSLCGLLAGGTVLDTQAMAWAAGASLGGCGGGGGVVRSVRVRGIVLEEDANGEMRPVPSGRLVYAVPADDPHSPQEVATDAEGRFRAELRTYESYGFYPKEYVADQENAAQLLCYLYPGYCASVPIIGVTGDGGTRARYSVRDSAQAGRSQEFAARYGVDIAVLAPVACVK